MSKIIRSNLVNFMCSGKTLSDRQACSHYEAGEFTESNGMKFSDCKNLLNPDLEIRDGMCWGINCLVDKCSTFMEYVKQKLEELGKINKEEKVVWTEDGILTKIKAE